LVSQASEDGSGVLINSTAISKKGNDLLKDKQFVDKLIYLQEIEDFKKELLLPTS
jgi:hypothetical protein